MVGGTERLVDDLASLPASDLDLDARALVHLDVGALLLLPPHLERHHLGLYRFHQAPKLVCHDIHPN